jgi:NitT/TauT family transport system ATP-binding protein
MSGVIIENISKFYLANGNKIQALDTVNLVIDDGEFICVVGHSGCGKTTLLNILAGFLKPSEGKITFNQSNSTNSLENDIGIVFQEYALFPWRTSIENVMFGLEMKGLSYAESKKIAQQYLELVHLGHAANIYPHQLSGGMRQRVAVARALAYDPDLLLMDEPFGALDAQTREHLQSLTEEIWLKTKKTVFYVTHNLSEATYLASKVVVMKANPGRIYKVIDIDLPRPRDPLSDEFVRIQRLLNNSIKDDDLTGKISIGDYE